LILSIGTFGVHVLRWQTESTPIGSMEWGYGHKYRVSNRDFMFGYVVGPAINRFRQVYTHSGQDYKCVSQKSMSVLWGNAHLTKVRVETCSVDMWLDYVLTCRVWSVHAHSEQSLL
jgi:hypothetical protein